MNDSDSNFRKLLPEEIGILKNQGCYSSNWDLIFISPTLDLSQIINVSFKGYLNIGNGVSLKNIPGGILGCTIRDNVIIENVGSIEFESESLNGVGTIVSVLDETGSRAIPIFPGLSSQLATLMARQPEWLQNTLQPGINSFIDSKVTPTVIGENAVIKNCGIIKNVYIGNEIKVEGASSLINGSIINNASPGKCFTSVGNEVEAENFILEDGKLESKCHIFNCYIGQGTIIGSGFSAHDSLFFANCSLENGEAHSLLAGPYTVSMHKGTLLIGCQTSFMNAGSSSNQSNHMYKLGPVHWGILERGVKTSSGSYLMHGAKIGIYSLLMGAHKTHPDSSAFPFSYLFGDERGGTIVVPGVMLRSCGLQRDEKKWPIRDRRLNRNLPLFDHITFPVLNPYTVDIMLKAISNIDELLTRPADDEHYIRYKGLKFTRAAAERAKSLYTLAIFKYLYLVLPNREFPAPDGNVAEEWIDLGGEVIPRSFLADIFNCDNLNEAEIILDSAFENYKSLELKWIGNRFGDWWRERSDQIEANAIRFDEIVEEDRQQYITQLSQESDMLAL